MTHWLCIIGERRALWWVLTESRLAFPMKRPRREYSELAAGDQLLLYRTRGAFGNPHRDRGSVIAQATANGPVTALDQPFQLHDRTFPVGCPITVHQLVPLGLGVELVPLRAHLTSLPPTPGGYAMALRKPLVRLSDADARLLREHLDKLGRPPAEILEGYRPPTRARI